MKMTKIKKENYEKYIELFLQENSKINLISKNDEKILFEKHIVDSLSLDYFFNKHLGYAVSGKKLLDIGTGGGFPAIPVAITYPQLQVTAIDSIRKKINAVENIKNNLKLDNLTLICDRAENITEKFDIITSRAVAKLDKICQYALPLLVQNGYFIAYKSKETDAEINDAKKNLKKYNSQVVDIISYDLALEEKFERNLIIIHKKA